MASATVKEFCSAWWAEVRHRIIGAVVFLDEPVSECLHWDKGMFDLMFSGAKSVKLLLPYETCYSEHKKAVFITQGYASDMELIEKILISSNVTHSILISTVSLDIVFMEISKDRNARELVSSGQAPFKAEESLTNLLQKWMKCKSKRDVHAQVLHMPIFTVSLTPVIFTTPPYTELCPLNEGNYIKEPINDLRFLHKSDCKVLRRLACNLNSMLDSMNLKEDVFFIGNYSGMLAGILEYSPKYINRRKNSLQPVSLILVDRTLDLCGVASHSCDTVYDKLRMVLPTYEGWASECAINMSAICTAKATKHPTNVHISPGSIFTPEDDDSSRTVDLMVYKNQDEVMLDVYSRLSKIDVNKSPSPENLSKVTPQRMEKTISSFKGNYDVISKHIGPIQQGLALIQMHKSRRRPAMELLMNFEKQLLQSLATSRESTSVLTQIAVLIKTRRQRDLPLENLLALLIQVYSLTGTEFPFVQSHELELMEALEKTFLEDDILENMSPEDAKQNAKDIMSTLTDIKYMRKSLTKYRSLLKPSESGDGFEYKGLVQQLVDDLVDPSQPEVPDLQVRSDGLKHLLKTGLSMFNINKKEKHPMDYPTVIIYMIGGTTVEECRNLNRTVITSGVDNTVLFGTTTLLNAKDTANMYLFSV